MDIFIKSFNRVYLLHRTIASVYHYLNGFDGRIVVLDDGTPQKYLDKISALFPEIQIIKSPYYFLKSKDILLNKEPKKLIPSKFWRNEVLKGSDYFILLEDDMWFSQTINYKDFKEDIYHLRLDMIKFMWLKNNKLISDNIIQKSTYFNIIKPEILTKSSFLFNAIFRTNKWKLGSLVMKLFNHKEELLKYYHIYSVAGGVFSKTYFKNTWKSTDDNVNELLNISSILKKVNEYKFANTKEEILKTTIKFTASNIDKDMYKANFDIFEFNKLLNESWYNESFYDFNFTKDVPNEWILECCKKNNFDMSLWQDWYQKIKINYELIGCKID